MFCIISVFVLLKFPTNSYSNEPCFDESANFMAHFNDCQKKAERGDALAQYNLAVMYDDGRGIPQDFQKAIYWYTKAAKQGDTKAQTSVARIHFIGFPTKNSRDVEKAIYWYTRAAQKRDVQAQAMLGWIYRQGAPNSPKDYNKAIFWYAKAAEQGNTVAQINLGLMYFEAEGTPKNPMKAYAFFSMAEANGEPDASELKQLVAAEMPPEQQLQAQQLARECLDPYSVGTECLVFDRR